MERPRLLRIFVGVVLVQAVVVAILGVIGLVNAEQIAEDANEDAASETTTTTTTTTTTPTATDATDATDATETDAPAAEPEDETTPGGVRFSAGIAIVYAIVQVGLTLLLYLRRDPRARVPLMILLVLSVFLAVLGIVTLMISLFGVYVLQFHKETRDWLAGVRPDEDDEPLEEQDELE